MRGLVVPLDPFRSGTAHQPVFRTSFDRRGAREFDGYAFDSSDTGRKLTVEVLLDGWPTAVVRADLFVPELAAKSVGDACYGFALALPDDDLSEACIIEARLANLGWIVGRPIRLAAESPKPGAALLSGEVRWLGALQIAGWVAASSDAVLTVLVDGLPVDRIRPSAWRHNDAGLGQVRAVRAFEARLPERFADGCVHYCSVVPAYGGELSGGPLAVLAFADGLRGAVVGRGLCDRDLLRADMFDRLVPASVPFSDYAKWRTRVDPEPDGPRMASCTVVLIGAADAEPSVASLRAQTGASWLAIALPPGPGPTEFSVDRLRRSLAEDPNPSDVIVFALAGTVLAPNALNRLADALARNAEAIAVYADLDLKGSDGTVWPLALPAFDYERMLEQGYCALFFAMRRSAVERSLAAGARDLFRLFNAMVDDRCAVPAIVHLPGPLATLPSFDAPAAAAALATAAREHLSRRAIEADVVAGKPGIWPTVRVKRRGARPSTTIVIPTRNRRDLLEGCIGSILPAVRRHKAEILIVDNDTSEPDALDYLDRLGRGIATVVPVPGTFNFARLNNVAAERASGDVLCLLNNDVIAEDADWLDELHARLCDDDVGAVAPLLIWPSGVVQHGGIVLGPKFEAAHAFTDRLHAEPGYTDLLRVAHECSALTAACLMTRRRDFLAVGGMDEIDFPINFNDVDYCLKLREAGRRIVFTPHARLIHYESASRGSAAGVTASGLFNRERGRLQLKWGEVLAADPYYSPILSLDPHPYSGLAGPARSSAPRVNRPPVARRVPPGF